MTRVPSLVDIMCSAIIKPSALIIQSLESHLNSVVWTWWCSPITRTKRGVWEERQCPRSDDDSTKNSDLVERFCGPRGERSCSAAEVGGDSGDSHAGSPCPTLRWRWPVQKKGKEGSFSYKATSGVCGNICSKINTAWCENHLCGQQDHNLVCSSNSHYIWKIYLILIYFFKLQQAEG